MANDIKLTDAQHKLLQGIVSYALSNIDDISDSLDADYTEADVKALAAKITELPVEKMATLSLKVIYNPAMTNVEELCGALDTLLEQALSTRGIMDEYGDPEFLSFEEA